MNKKSFAQRILAVALCLIMVLGLMPMSVFASDTFPGKPDGMTVTGSAIETINGQDVWLCPSSGGNIVKTTSGNGYAIYEAAPYGGYTFSHWATYCVAADWWDTFESANRYDEEEGYAFSKFDSKMTRYDEKDDQIRVNTSSEANYTYYVYAVFVQGVSVSISVEGGGATIHAKNLDNYNGSEYEFYVKDAEGTVHFGVGKNSKMQVQILSDWVTYYEHVYVNDVDVIDSSYVYYSEYGSDRRHFYVQTFTVTAPITIRAVTKQRGVNVTFYSNDVNATGTMDKQFMLCYEDYDLPENRFVNKGYIFSGWNTKADGSGTPYADKQSVRFTIADDGTELALYAQWAECNNHTWTNGECTACGTVCSHSGGTATCLEQATCSECGEKYGELAKHNIVYAGSNNRIVETCTAGCGHTATATVDRDETVNTVYTGSAVEALKIDYSDNWQGGQLDIVYSNNVNAGTASGTISIGDVTASQTFEITKATMSDVSAQGYSGIYDGQAHGITVNAPAGATVSYKVGDGEYNTENPTFKDAGTYTVFYKVSMANHDDVEGTAEVKIDTAPLTVTANDHSIKYGEAPANKGVTYSGFVSNETEAVLSGTLAFDYTYANGNNVGAYEITPKGLSSNNYEITFINGTLTVEKADATYTAPTANEVTYTGAMQELVTAGTVDGGKMVFSLDKEGGYSETLSAKKAGEYTVWYKVIGDDNHNNTAPASITVENKKATPDLGTVSADGTVDDTTKPEDVVLTQTGTVEGIFVITDSVMLANKAVYNYTFTPHDTDNWNSVNGQVMIDVLDTIAPTIGISLDDHKWTFWDTITFGLFYNEAQEVTIAYADNENGSGLKDMLHFVANEEMSLDELQDVQWTAYTEAFDIDPDGKYVVYAKAVDNDGNILIINSDGVVVDETAAVVSGITDGETYYGQLVFTVVDELAGVKSVVIDSNDVTRFEGQYVINGDNAEHTVVVTDNAGNVTEYKVTVYKNYTVTYVADGETISTETVGHSKDATLPAVPAKQGFVGKWDNDGKNITDDSTINAVYTEIPVVNPDEVKPEDKSDLEDTKKQLEDMLDDDSYTEDDKKDIQDAIDDIDDALEAIGNVEEVLELIGKLPDTIKKEDEAAIKAADDAYSALTDYEKSLVDEDVKKALDDAKAALAELKKPADPDKPVDPDKPADPNSPATGENSHVSLWIALLFISGSAVITLTVCDRKRRTAANK